MLSPFTLRTSLRIFDDTLVATRTLFRTHVPSGGNGLIIYFFQKVLSSFSLDLFDTRIRLLPASEWLTMWDIETAALKSSGNPNSFLVDTARISLVMA